MPSPRSAVSVAPTTKVSDREPPPGSLVGRALALVAWPLAVLAPLAMWNGAIAVVVAHAPDLVIDGRCSEPWGPCAAPMPDVVADVGTLGQPLVVMVGATLGLTVLRGVAARRRFGAALVLLAGEAALVALVGITVIRVGAELR